MTHETFTQDNWRPHSVYVSQNPFLKGNTLQEMTDFDPVANKTSIGQFYNYCDLCAIPLTKRQIPLDYLRLSGGEKKQIALLRALLLGKNFILLDEITAGLDYDLALDILSRMRRSLQDYTIVMTTHEDTYDQFFDRIYEIK